MDIKIYVFQVQGQMFNESYNMIYSLEMRSIYIDLAQEDYGVKIGSLILKDHQKIKGIHSKTIVNLGNYNDVEQKLYQKQEENPLVFKDNQFESFTSNLSKYIHRDKSIKELKESHYEKTFFDLQCSDAQYQENVFKPLKFNIQTEISSIDFCLVLVLNHKSGRIEMKINKILVIWNEEFLLKMQSYLLDTKKLIEKHVLTILQKKNQTFLDDYEHSAEDQSDEEDKEAEKEEDKKKEENQLNNLKPKLLSKGRSVRSLR